MRALIATLIALMLFATTPAAAAAPLVPDGKALGPVPARGLIHFEYHSSLLASNGEYQGRKLQ